MRQPIALFLVGIVACLAVAELIRADSMPPAAPSDDAALTLADCDTLALHQSETIAIQQERIKETEGRFLQAMSAALPRASFVLSDKRQDGSGGSAFTLRDVPENRFTFSQPLFSGLKEFAAMAGSRAEHRQRVNERRRAEQVLLADVANAFYVLREQREDLQTLETTRLALLQRIDELEQRERLGRSRPSEVISAEAQLRRVEAELESARGLETAARQLLEFLIGRESLPAIVEAAAAFPPPLDPEPAYVSAAASRPDVLAAEQAWRVARQQVVIAQAKFWPTVGLEGNYYTRRVGVASDVDWDALLKVDVPLFQGGQALGGRREFASRARQEQLRYVQTKRAAALQAQDAYAKLAAGLARRAALEQAQTAAEEDYRLQMEDYRLNLVNNLNVLQSLQALQDARREALHAAYESKRLYWQLLVDSGTAVISRPPAHMESHRP